MSDDHLTLPDEEPTAAATPVSDELEVAQGGTACAECGGHIEPQQQYCLECGAPTPYAVPLRTRRSGPALIAASMLALGIGGASVIYAATKEDRGGSSSVASVATVPTSFPTSTFGTNPFPTGTTSTLLTFPTTTFGEPTTTFTPSTTQSTTTFTTTFSTTTSTMPTTDTTGDPTIDDQIDEWEYPDETRYTVVMRSYKKRADAEDYRDQLNDANVSAGVLISEYYASLKAGWFVVFHGAYLTQARANQELNRLKSRYPAAYVRKVEL